MSPRTNVAALDHEESFRLLVESVEDYAIFVMDPEGRVATWGRGAAAMLGYTLEEMRGRTFAAFYPPEDVAAGRPSKVLREAAQHARFAEDGWRLRKDGSRFWASTVVTALRGEDGVLRGFGEITRDLTEVRAAEQHRSRHVDALQRSNHELETFASVASHDLQEPLRKIQAFGDRLASRCEAVLSPEGKDDLRRMRSAASRMQALVEGLLTYARVGMRADPRRVVDLNLVLREVLGDFDVRVQETGARIEASTLPSVFADPLQMRQLLQNLLSNALKFHRDGQPPVVHVRGARTGGPDASWELVVEDEGIGFEAKHAERIFGLFQRLHSRTDYEGTGVGLALCRRIVAHHGGSITATTPLGRGARFVVHVPIEPGRDPA